MISKGTPSSLRPVSHLAAEASADLMRFIALFILLQMRCTEIADLLILTHFLSLKRLNVARGGLLQATRGRHTSHAWRQKCMLICCCSSQFQRLLQLPCATLKTADPYRAAASQEPLGAQGGVSQATRWIPHKPYLAARGSAHSAEPFHTQTLKPEENRARTIGN